jgi:hypothetical protein
MMSEPLISKEVEASDNSNHNKHLLTLCKFIKKNVGLIIITILSITSLAVNSHLQSQLNKTTGEVNQANIMFKTLISEYDVEEIRELVQSSKQTLNDLRAILGNSTSIISSYGKINSDLLRSINKSIAITNNSLIAISDQTNRSLDTIMTMGISVSITINSLKDLSIINITSLYEKIDFDLLRTINKSVAITNDSLIAINDQTNRSLNAIITEKNNVSITINNLKDLSVTHINTSSREALLSIQNAGQMILSHEQSILDSTEQLLNSSIMIFPAYPILCYTGSPCLIGPECFPNYASLECNNSQLIIRTAGTYLIGFRIWYFPETAGTNDTYNTIICICINATYPSASCNCNYCVRYQTKFQSYFDGEIEQILDLKTNDIIRFYFNLPAYQTQIKDTTSFMLIRTKPGMWGH